MTHFVKERVVSRRSTRRRLARAAAFLVSAAISAGALTAHAEVLVSNMSKANERHVERLEHPGDGPDELLGGGYVVPWTRFQLGWPWVPAIAQSFRTGSNAAGYRLESVAVDAVTEQDRFLARVFSRKPYSSDPTKYVPGQPLLELDLRAARNGRVFVDARRTNGEYPKLEPDSDYFIVFTPLSRAIRFSWTRSNGEDPGGAPGWSIGDTSYSLVGGWPENRWQSLRGAQFYDPAIKIAINGVAITGGEPVMDNGIGAGGTTRSVAENSAAGTNVGAPVTATDPDGDTLTYRLGGGNVGAFEIDAASGQIRTRAGVDYDYEIKPSYSVRVVADDGHGNTGSAMVTINLTDVSEVLTASFLDAPGEHQGRVFTVRLEFSEPVATSYRVLRDGGIQATNGRVVRAKQLKRMVASNGRSAAPVWEIMVVPTGGDIGISLPAPAPAACDDPAAAVCTTDGRPLSAPASVQVPEGTVPDLTAEFVGLPAQHDGSSGVAMTIELSAGVTTTAQAMREDVLVVTNGTVTGAWPETRGMDRWQVRLQPRSLEDMSVSIAKTESCDDPDAVCSVDGRMLSAAVTAEVVGPANQPLTGEFGAPDTHDGATAFEMYVKFSWPVTAKRQTMRDHVLSVTNGEVLDAWREPGDDKKWWFLILPLSGEDVLINLPATTDCSDSGAVCTADGRRVQALDGKEVPAVGVAVDETAPTLRGAAVDGTSLVLVYDEGMDEESTPPASAFAVTVAGATREVATVAVSGRSVTLTLSAAVEHGETVAVDYRVPTGADAQPSRDTDGNDAAALSGRSVTNETPAPDETAPELVSATVDGTSLVLTYDEELDTASVPPAGAFAVTAAGATREVATVAVSGPSATLALSAAAAHGDAVTVDYTVPTGTDPKPIRDAAGNDAAALSGRSVTNETLPLVTAEFVGVPTGHGGNPFTFELRLSESVQSTYRTLRDSAFTVTGGEVTAAHRLETDLRWQITVEPANGNDEVVVTLPATTDCAAEGAVCAADGRPLSAPVTETVVANGPLTVRFEDMPETHDGVNPIEFKVIFSEEVDPGYGYMTFRNKTMAMRLGGRKIHPRRGYKLDPPSTRRWGVVVEHKPGDADVRYGDFTVTISRTGNCDDAGAVCTAGRKNLSNSISATVPSPPLLAVADTEVREGDGATAMFTVTLNRGAPGRVRVDFATADGTATAGDDYTETRGRLTFERGETQKTIAVPVIDDREEDGGETFTLTLSNISGAGAYLADAEATATILNSETVEEPAEEEPTEEEQRVEPLTATFLEVPRTHTGSEISFELRFSEEFGLSYKTLQGYNNEPSVIDVTNGEVTNASRIGGVNQRWTIRIQPDAGKDVTITLPATTDCAAAHAICTDDDRPLSRAATTTVPVQLTPLTVAFETAPPDEHDGATPFSFRLAFSENLGTYSYKTMRDTSLTVMQGTTRLVPTEAKRVYPEETPRINQAWDIKVTPTTKENITIRLAPTATCTDAGAMCTADARNLSNTITDAVQGPPGLSVADARVNESTANATLDFVVTLSRASAQTVTVAYATSDGSATEGHDYTAVSDTLTFAPGETSKTVSVAVLDDIPDEGDETLTLTLSSHSGGNAYLADATATGTIENTDPLQQVWLSRFGRTVATHVTDAVGERLRGGPGQASQVTLGGYRLPLGGYPPSLGRTPGREALPAPGAEPGPDLSRAPHAGRTVELRDLLLGSSFQLDLGRDGSGAGPRLTAWGRFAGTRFDGNTDDLSLDGDVLTGTVGVDRSWGRLLAGVAVAYSRGQGSFNRPGMAGRGRGDLEHVLTSFHPYLRYGLNDRLEVWGLLGYGQGRWDLEMDTGQDLETDTDLVMGAFGGRGVLLAAADSGGFELAARTDGMLARTASDATAGLAAGEGDARRLRLILEGSRALAWGGGRRLTPRVEVGLRHDSGDAESGFGLEVGGRLRYADPAWGLTVEGAVRGLLAHEDGDYREWGASATLRVAPGDSGQGFSLALSPQWGAASSGVDGLWTRQTAAGLAPGDRPRSGAGRLTAEVGYGLPSPVGAGLLTPYAGTALAEGETRTYRLGMRLRLDGYAGLALNLEGRRQRPADRQPVDRSLYLQATWRF